MKNREKYKDEILERIQKDDLCTFMQEEVIPTMNPYAKNLCNCTGRCAECTGALFNIWLEEEYKESKVDWSKVEVDTPVLVRSNEDEQWKRRHFSKYLDGRVYTFNTGRTSWTGMYATDWKYAKLAEAEE